MRKIIFILLLCLTCEMGYATPQIHDRIVIGGEVWEIPVSPLTKLDADTYDAVMEVFGERVAVSSANRRGYVAYWRVEKRHIYLECLETSYSGGKPKVVDMAPVAAELKKYRHRGRIKAKWLTGEITIIKDPDSRQELKVKRGRICK